MFKAAQVHGAIHRFERLPTIESASAPAGTWRAAPVRAHPLVGVIRNPRSHRNGGRAEAEADLLPFGARILARVPERRSELPEILAEFAREQVDYIAIDGGDGTVRDVLTCGAGMFGERWPAIIVLPHGKTNALAHDLGIPVSWTLTDALAAARTGKVAARRPIVVTQRDDERARVYGFVLGGGAFTQAIGLGQNAHDVGAFDAAVVGLTAAWSVLQALFGRAGNPWRRTTMMRLADPDGRALDHVGGAEPDQRWIIVASTLRSFPAGLRPFGRARGRLRVAVLDNARRTLLARLPLIFTGRAGNSTERLGYHSFGADSLDFDIGDRFILDGEAFPAGSYRLKAGPKLHFVVP